MQRNPFDGRQQRALTSKQIWAFSWDVVKKSISLYFGNLFHYLGFIVLVALVTFVATVPVMGSQNQKLVNAINRLIFLFFSPLIGGAIVYSALQQLRKKRVSFIESLAKGLSKWIVLLLALTIYWIVVTFGLFLLIIPGVIAIGGFYLIVPIIMLEGKNFISAFSRSWELTYGYKRAIVNAAILLGLVGIFFYAVLFFLAFYTILMAGSLMGQYVAVSLFVFFILFGQLTLYYLQVIASSVMYYKIREQKEGLGLEELIRVFD